MTVELSKQNIKKLLKARQLVDVCRANKNEVRRETDYNQMQAKFTEHIQVRDKALAKLGFASYIDFNNFNSEMCIAELQAYMPLLSYCDNCKGYDGIPPCEITCGQSSLHYKWTGSQVDIDRFWEFIFIIVQQITYDKNILIHVPDSIAIPTKLRSGMKLSKETAVNYSICPEGHGFRFDYIRDPQFDVSWK